MSGESDSRKDSHSTESKERPQILIKLHFRELCDSKLTGLHTFDNWPFYDLKISQKDKGRLWVHETPILELIFVTLTENSSVVTNNTQEPQGHYFQILHAYDQATRKHLFLYPQGDRPGLRKPKKGKHQH